jgi:hypothetical protein
MTHSAQMLYSFFAIFFFMSTISQAQIQLQHKFQPGQSATSKTQVKVQGDSLIGGENAKTNLSIQMIKSLSVGHVSDMGTADLSVTVERLQTNGTMNNEPFRENLHGDRLKQVLFGMNKQQVEITPYGHVKGNSASPLGQLGISLPTNLSDSGGFEFPTFPAEPVGIGSTWTEDGVLIQHNRVDFSEGEGVYRLQGYKITPQGKAAIIKYKKVTDLSGMGLGNLANPGSIMGSSPHTSGAAKVGGLVISLEGEILFLVHQGVVIQTTQKGFWNMNMGTTSTEFRKNTQVNQRGMQLYIQSNFQWNIPQREKQQNMVRQQPQQQQPPIENTIPINPPTVIINQNKEIP